MAPSSALDKKSKFLTFWLFSDYNTPRNKKREESSSGCSTPRLDPLASVTTTTTSTASTGPDSSLFSDYYDTPLDGSGISTEVSQTPRMPLLPDDPVLDTGAHMGPCDIAGRLNWDSPDQAARLKKIRLLRRNMLRRRQHGRESASTSSGAASVGVAFAPALAFPPVGHRRAGLTRCGPLKNIFLASSKPGRTHVNSLSLAQAETVRAPKTEKCSVGQSSAHPSGTMFRSSLSLNPHRGPVGSADKPPEAAGTPTGRAHEAVKVSPERPCTPLLDSIQGNSAIPLAEGMYSSSIHCCSVTNGMPLGTPARRPATENAGARLEAAEAVSGEWLSTAAVERSVFWRMPGAPLSNKASLGCNSDSAVTPSVPTPGRCEGSELASSTKVDRRRLSLSQSDPTEPLAMSDPKRGAFHIHSEQLPTATERERQASLDSYPEDCSRTPLSRQESGVSTRHRGYHSCLDGAADASVAVETPEPGTPQPLDDLTSTPHRSEPQRRQRCRRLTVTGLPSASRQNDFENKRREIHSDTGHFDSASLMSLGIGYTCKKGLKPESPNQDDFFIIRMDDWSLYGVFDGHGPYGHDVSNYVQRELPNLICSNPNFHERPTLALSAAFSQVHRMLEAEGSGFDCSMSGCTASVILHRKKDNKLYIAHVGDSRCVLGQRHGNVVKAIDLTADHKPNSDAEKRRIIAAGGQVKRLEGDIPYRVFLRGRLYPGLAMSRAIGDTIGTQAGVICEPDVREYALNIERDLFIVLCSDGVWEFLESQEVVDIIHSNGRAAVQHSADVLAEQSWSRWMLEGDVVDDITAEIIYLDCV